MVIHILQIKKMSSLKLSDLYKLSYNHITEMLGDVTDFRLEQAEKSGHSANWDVVVSFLLPNKNPVNTGLMALSGKFQQYERVYKRLILDKEGELLKFLLYKE